LRLPNSRHSHRSARSRIYGCSSVAIACLLRPALSMARPLLQLMGLERRLDGHHRPALQTCGSTVHASGPLGVVPCTRAIPRCPRARWDSVRIHPPSSPRFSTNPPRHSASDGSLALRLYGLAPMAEELLGCRPRRSMASLKKPSRSGSKDNAGMGVALPQASTRLIFVFKHGRQGAPPTTSQLGQFGPQPALMSGANPGANSPSPAWRRGGQSLGAANPTG